MQSSKDSCPPLLDRITNAQLLHYFDRTWSLYEYLFRSIVDEKAYYTHPDVLRHPMIFYLGHTAAFYINKLKLAGILTTGINDYYEKLFAKGVDPKTPDDLPPQVEWPELEQVWEYRRRVYETMREVIAHLPLDLPIIATKPQWAILMGIEHDGLHFETSSVLIKQLPPSVLRRPANWQYAESQGEQMANEMIYVAPGNVTLGKRNNILTYGWDNEYGSLDVQVSEFEASKNHITHYEFLEFVENGGYKNKDYWSNEGWNWVTTNQIQHPMFWLSSGNGYRYRAMFDEIEMPWNWPVEVDFFEAQAFCKWKGKDVRLLTESEFALIAQQAPQIDQDTIFCDCYNNNFKVGSPTPVGQFAQGRTSSGFNDVFGNVWQWVQNDFFPLPGFQPHPYYEDFSLPYFNNQHMMLLGGSWATVGTAVSKYYRLWFRKYFFQHAGFRIAKSIGN